MIRALAVALLSIVALSARAHVGSPDLFYSGSIGQYPARITIRMPGVIPGRAEISVRVETTDRVEVSFLPLYAKTAVKNAPPPDIGRLVQGETNLYTGELWLMSFGAYSVEVRVQGAKGSGSVQIPLTSVASRQLPMPSFLGKVLSALALTLLVGGIGIAAAAGREATLAPGQAAGKSERRKGLVAALATLGILVGGVVGGRHWWSVEEGSFRRHLREGAWPDLGVEVKVIDSQTLLQLEVGKNAFASDYKPSLIPDHGKLMHLFLIREGSLDAFAHLHPVRKKGYTFEVALPPLPEGRYTVFTDLTFEGGSSSTATAAITLPAVAPTGSVDSSTLPLQSDPDDSWSAYANEAVPPADASAPLFHCADGTAVTWYPPPLRLRRSSYAAPSVRKGACSNSNA